MTGEETEVLAFLAELKSLIGYGKFIMQGDRQKNHNTLIQLNITENQRLTHIYNLNKEDYSEGPLPDHGGGEDVWVFGITINAHEVYIKLTINRQHGKNAICISFHIAEHPMKYPFKE